MSWNKPYVGYTIMEKSNQSYWCSEVFWSRKTPTPETHGDKFLYVVGPFKNRKDADCNALF